jgi:hypothetical protein
MLEKPITHQDLINSELNTLGILRERLNTAITILDADVTDIKAVHGFDKIEAYKAECKEALRLINEKGTALESLLRGLLEVPNQ